MKTELDNLPDEFKNIFLHAKNQVKRFGDAFHLAEFAFLSTQIVFSVDFNDEVKNTVSEQSRALIYEVFDDNEFVDATTELLDRNKDDYIQNLYAQGLVYLWTSLESFVKQLIISLIEFDENTLSGDSFSKVKIPMSEFFSLQSDEKSLFLAELIIDTLNCSHKQGVSRFECLLDPFGLSGNFDPEFKTRIFLLHQVRNCIVHNDSIADKRFVRICEWLGYKVGEKIIITKDDYQSHEIAVWAYMQEVFFRLNKKLGAPDDYLAVLRKAIDELFAT